MAENEAPKKIYLERVLCSNEVYGTWKSQKTISDDIEYVRKDAFIEKACVWLSKHAKKYYFNKEGHYLGTDELVEDFKITMRL